MGGEEGFGLMSLLLRLFSSSKEGSRIKTFLSVEEGGIGRNLPIPPLQSFTRHGLGGADLVGEEEASP